MTKATEPQTSLGKVRDIITGDHYGKVCRTRSADFGEGTYLIVKHPGKYFSETCRFVKLPAGNVLFYDSMARDDVLEIREANL